MPGHRKVTRLEYLNQQTLAKQLYYLICHPHSKMKAIIEAVKYIKSILPPLITTHLCNVLNKLCYGKVHNYNIEKFVFLCTELRGENFSIDSPVFDLSKLCLYNGKYIKHVKLSCTTFRALGLYNSDNHQFKDMETNYYSMLNIFLSTLINLTVFYCYQFADSNSLKVLSMSCPHLKELYLQVCSEVNDFGLFYLCGYYPDDEDDSNFDFRTLKEGVQIKSKCVCTKLSIVKIEDTMVSNEGAAMLLHTFPNLTTLDIVPEISIGDIFTLLHGTNPDNYGHITKKYSLTSLHSPVQIDEDIYALIVQTCKHLDDINIRCNGVERNDRNIFANFLSVQVKKFHIIDCNMDALIWYLQKRGSDLQCLSIQHLITAAPSVNINRSHLQQLIQFCPNLNDFNLQLYNDNIYPNVPYSSFGKDVLFFTSLKQLKMEAVNLCPTDLKVLISKCLSLKGIELYCQTFDFIDDIFIYDLLATGCFEELTSLFIYKPLITLAGLQRLVRECPMLRSVGPLSTWCISKEQIDEFTTETTTNNWDIDIASFELKLTFVI